MTCETCDLLRTFETCDKVDAAEHYANLLLAQKEARPRWIRFNAILHFRFGDEGLVNIQRAAKEIAQRTKIL